MPSAAEIEPHRVRQLRQADIGAFGQIEGVGASHVLDPDIGVLRACHRAVVRVESGDRHHGPLLVKGQRNGQIERHLVVDVLEIEVDASPVKVAPHRHANLPPFVGPEACISDAILRSVEAPHEEPPVAERVPVVGVKPLAAEVTQRDFHGRPRACTTLLGDEVDSTARRERSEDGRGATTNRLNAFDGAVEPEGLVRVQIAQPAIGLNRQTVFL